MILGSLITLITVATSVQGDVNGLWSVDCGLCNVQCAMQYGIVWVDGWCMVRSMRRWVIKEWRTETGGKKVGREHKQTRKARRDCDWEGKEEETHGDADADADAQPAEQQTQKEEEADPARAAVGCQWSVVRDQWPRGGVGTVNSAVQGSGRRWIVVTGP